MGQTASQLFLLRFSRTSSGLVILIGVIAMVGWLLNISLLKGGLPWSVAMNPFTAILLVISGISLRRQIRPDVESPARSRDWIALGLALIVALAGAAKLAEYVFSSGPGWDETFFRSKTAVGMSLNSAINFLFCGVGLLSLDWETRRGIRPAQVCFLPAALIALLALIGYAYRTLPLYSIGSTKPMALNSALAFEFLCLGALAARPARGVMTAITSDTTGGVMARRLLPAAVLIPLLLGAVRFAIERRKFVEAGIGMSLFAVANMVLFTCLVWWTAGRLYRVEQDRLLTERRLAVQHAVTRVLAESPDTADATGKILREICGSLEWQTGAWWWADEEQRALHCGQVYFTDNAFTEFTQTSMRTVLPYGVGLPGRTWEARKPVWIQDVAEDRKFIQRTEAARAGLHCAFAFPVQFDDSVCGVMEFFSVKVKEPDEALLQMLAAIGSQIGQFIERRRAEEQLRQTSADLARSNTDLQQFAYVASHDLTEPLRTISSYLELLSEHSRGKLGEEGQEFVGHAVDGAQRMQALIKDLLAYARVDVRARAFEATDAGKALGSALANLKVTIEESSAIVENEPLPTVNADSLQLSQVFQNLISNAIKFRGKAPPRIRVGAQRSNGEWIFHVSDNGIGFDAGESERIFVLFQRLHTRQEYPGTGMGLAICKKIIERHGGRIWVESQRGQGATFYFTLPAKSWEAGGAGGETSNIEHRTSNSE